MLLFKATEDQAEGTIELSMLSPELALRVILSAAKNLIDSLREDTAKSSIIPFRADSAKNPGRSGYSREFIAAINNGDK